MLSTENLLVYKGRLNAFSIDKFLFYLTLLIDCEKRISFRRHKLCKKASLRVTIVMNKHESFIASLLQKDCSDPSLFFSFSSFADERSATRIQPMPSCFESTRGHYNW